MTLKDVLLEALDKVSEEEILEILGVNPGGGEEDAAQKLEQRRKTDRERQARHRANKAGKKVADPEPEETEETEEAGEEDFAAKYADKTAVELFKLCKARKMTTVVPKKPQKFYVDLLVEQDKKEVAAKAKEAEDEADGGDWGDEDDQEDEKPVTKKGRKASSKKAPAPDPDDDDGEWNI